MIANRLVIGVLGAIELPVVSFLFAREAWGQGYAREALDAFVRYSFERGIPLLCAATHEGNIAARTLLERAGFREVGRSEDLWQVHDAPAQGVHYRINRDPNAPMRDPFVSAEPAPIRTD